MGWSLTSLTTVATGDDAFEYNKGGGISTYGRQIWNAMRESALFGTKGKHSVTSLPQGNPERWKQFV